jgi:hypothetical protein
MIYHPVMESYHLVIGSRSTAMRPPAGRRSRTSPWATVAWTLVVLALSALVVGVWVHDDPETPLDERADVFLLLALIVGVVTFTIELGPGRAPDPERRGWPGWTILTSLVARLRR